MGCKCMTPKEEENGEIYKLPHDDDHFNELYQDYNSNEPYNSNMNDNFDENDIINHLMQNGNNYENNKIIMKILKYQVILSI